MRAFITGMGAITPAGIGCAAILEAMEKATRSLRPLTLLPAPGKGPLPVGEITEFQWDRTVPRTHALALVAAREALAGSSEPPDAIVLGGTTGGMPATEELLKAGNNDPEAYRFHGTGTVASYLARELGCHGIVLTVSTACSSGAAALKISRELIRAGLARRVLAGGVDALCRLTYHGFGMLQLIDPAGTRPLDKTRAGMTVGEAAALLLVEGASQPPALALAELRGAGLSCDAYHPSAPHPEGLGALAAMRNALEEAGIRPEQIDYINLHGTGTANNDPAEAAAILALFEGKPLPPLSSTKGGISHSLAAAGAVEAIISILAIRHGLLPANVGCTQPDEALGLVPILAPTRGNVSVVLSNSLGFGGNNAAVVLARADLPVAEADPAGPGVLAVLARSCLTGAGHTAASVERFLAGQSLAGACGEEVMVKDLPPRSLRRMKRLPKMALALTASLAPAGAQLTPSPKSVFLGTAWGPLSETYDFLERLFASGEERSSPTDFVGSVHNAVAGQAAIQLAATGANLTMTGGDTSFEQALLAATMLVAPGEAALLMGVEEAHPRFSPLLDLSVAGTPPSDGGAALLVSRPAPGAAVHGPVVTIPFLATAGPAASPIGGLVDSLGGREAVASRVGALLVNLPAAHAATGQDQLAEFLRLTGFAGASVDLRSLVGQYAAVSATGLVLACALLEAGSLPPALTGGREIPLAGKSLLLLTLGPTVAAIRVSFG